MSSSSTSNRETSNSENSFFSEDATRFGDTPTEKINVKKLKIGRVIGKGGNGTVASAFDRSTNKLYAVKKMEKLKNGFIPTNTDQELRMAKRLEHENIAKVYDTYTSHNSAYIIMNKYRNLLEYIAENFPIKTDLLQKLTREMVGTIKYLHDQKIAHRDIKPENFLLDKDYNIKLCDFGLAVENAGRTSERKGTFYYFSPQILLGNSDPLKSDIWALGITFYVMATLDIPKPYENVDFRDLKKKEFQITCPSNVTRNFADLIEKMLAYKESNRLDINEVASHKWFDEKVEVSHSSKKTSKVVAHTTTDTIQSLEDYDYLTKSKVFNPSTFAYVKSKDSSLITLFNEIFKKQSIESKLTRKKF